MVNLWDFVLSARGKDLRVNFPIKFPEGGDETGSDLDTLAAETLIDPGADECSIPIRYSP